jgi:hypothetical protein
LTPLACYERRRVFTRFEIETELKIGGDYDHDWAPALDAIARAVGHEVRSVGRSERRVTYYDQDDLFLERGCSLRASRRGSGVHTYVFKRPIERDPRGFVVRSEVTLETASASELLDPADPFHRSTLLLREAERVAEERCAPSGLELRPRLVLESSRTQYPLHGVDARVAFALVMFVDRVIAFDLHGERRHFSELEVEVTRTWSGGFDLLGRLAVALANVGYPWRTSSKYESAWHALRGTAR